MVNLCNIKANIVQHRVSFVKGLVLWLYYIVEYNKCVLILDSNSSMPINVVMLGMDAPNLGTSREITKKKDIGKKNSKSNISVSLSSSKLIPPPEKPAK